MKRRIFILLIFFVVPLLAGCVSNVKKDNEKINVMVSVLPQMDFVKRIGGDKVDVEVMIGPGFNHATYEPTPGQIKDLSQMDLYVRIGHIAFEKSQMQRLQDINPQMKVVDSSVGIKTRESQDEDEAGADPHIWMAPALVKIQAENIYQALVDIRPEYKDYFEANKNNFLSDLDVLDKKLTEIFEPIKGQTVLVFHPAFGYLADAYGFAQESIEEEGKDPSITQLKEIIDKAKKDNIKVIFLQKQFSEKSARVVADSIGGTVVAIDPLAPDYFSNMELIAQSIKDNLTK